MQHAIFYLGGAAASALTQVMLSRFGLRNAMLIKAGTDAVTLVFAFLLIKERKVIDTNGDHRKTVWYDKKFLTDPIFWSIVGCMYCCSFGYQVPNVYLPTYAKQNIPNLSDIVNATSIAIFVFLDTQFVALGSPPDRAQCFFRNRMLLCWLHCGYNRCYERLIRFCHVIWHGSITHVEFRS